MGDTLVATLVRVKFEHVPQQPLILVYDGDGAGCDLNNPGPPIGRVAHWVTHGSLWYSTVILSPDQVYDIIW